MAGECKLRMFRGGSWRNAPNYVLTGGRYSDPPTGRYGFLASAFVRVMP